MYERVIEKRSKTLGEDHPDTLTAVQMLALLFNEKGDREELQKASILFDRISSIFQSDKGVKNNLIQILENLYKNRGKVLGRDHSLTLKAFKYLSILKEKLYIRRL